MVSCKKNKAFTLVELLVALMVTAIIMGAVASIAFAMSSANDTGSEISEKQAQLRYTSLRLAELIKHCKLVAAQVGDDLVLWRNDDNDDGKMNPTELVYIETGSGHDYLRLLEFTLHPDGAVSLSNIRNGIKPVLISWCNGRRTDLLPDCRNVQFVLGGNAPSTGFVSIAFELSEDGVWRQYQISARLNNWGGYLIDSDDELVSGDDD